MESDAFNWVDAPMLISPMERITGRHIEFVLTKSRKTRDPLFLGFRGHIQSVLLDIKNKIFGPPNAPNISQISKLPMTMVMIMSATTTDTTTSHTHNRME